MADTSPRPSVKAWLTAPAATAATAQARPATGKPVALWGPRTGLRLSRHEQYLGWSLLLRSQAFVAKSEEHTAAAASLDASTAPAK